MTMSEHDPFAQHETPAPAAEAPASTPGSGGIAAESGSYVPPSFVPPPPPKKSRAGTFIIGALSGCLILVVGLVLFAIAIAASRGSGGSMSLSASKIAVVPIEGEILESREAIELLRRYAHQVTVKGIVIRINSPGGAIAPSQEIYSEVLRLREESGKPIVASLDSVAASGGYYIASATDHIVANPGSITGSIGVILQWMDIEELVRWAKMKPETITSGALKAAGSPYRQMTPQEREYFQRIVLQLHSQFVRAVAAGRKGKLSEAEVMKLADGRVFTGEEALTLKLVDEMGSLQHAVAVAGRMAGIDGEPAMVYPRRRDATFLDLLTDSGDAQSIIESIVNRRAPRFLYLWEAAGASVK